jgi:hypothetical protein
MTTDLERLARANPVPEPYDDDPDAADELLRRVLLETPPVSPRRGGARVRRGPARRPRHPRGRQLGVVGRRRHPPVTLILKLRIMN